MRTIYKNAIIVIAIVLAQMVVAQSVRTKTNLKNSFLTEKGNFAIGVDASPIINYVGNMMNENNVNTINLSAPIMYTKYYLTDNTALRTILGLQTSTKSQLYYVQDDFAKFVNPLSNAQVTDKKKDNSNKFYLSSGIQKIFGENRLRGFYGAQLFTEFGKDKVTYTYGNPITSLNPTPSSNPAPFLGERKLSEVTSHDFTLGAGGIAGFEYYVAPRLCIGGEISLNVVYIQKLQTYQKSEKIVSDKVITIDKALSPGGHEVIFQTSSFTPETFQRLGLYVMLLL